MSLSGIRECVVCLNQIELLFSYDNSTWMGSREVPRNEYFKDGYFFILFYLLWAFRPFPYSTKWAREKTTANLAYLVNYTKKRKNINKTVIVISIAIVRFCLLLGPSR